MTRLGVLNIKQRAICQITDRRTLLGHKQTPLLVEQVKQALKEQQAFGESKHDLKNNNPKELQNKIFSYNTMKAYINECCKFVKWCKENYKSKTLEQCHAHISEYLSRYKDEQTKERYSAYTLQKEASAIAKMYKESRENNNTYRINGEQIVRERTNITRSRNEVPNDRHFSQTRNKDLIDFCRSTGLRRNELENLRGDRLSFNEKTRTYQLTVNQGTKGGKARTVEVIGNVKNVVELCRQAGHEKVFAKVHTHADIHSYRSEYATALYEKYARDINSLDKKELYCCKKDLNGVKYDRQAMKIVSSNLGHNRISVIADHYLRA